MTVICKKCKHHNERYLTDYCRRHGKKQPDRITGKVEWYSVRCSQERSSRTDTCGPEGKYFEPKLNVLSTLANLFKIEINWEK